MGRLLRLITMLPSLASVRLTLRLMPTTAMEVMVDTVLAMEATAMVVLATATAKGLPTLRLMPTTVMEDMVATVLATAMEVTARGLLTLRPTPTTVTEDMVDTDWAMEDTAMAVLAMAMARGLLMLMLSTAMEDMVLAFMESLPHA